MFFRAHSPFEVQTAWFAATILCSLKAQGIHAKPLELRCDQARGPPKTGKFILFLKIPYNSLRRFTSEVQRVSLNGMAAREVGETGGVKGFSRRRRCERSEHP
jgi:hypothetical protein